MDGRLLSSAGAVSYWPAGQLSQTDGSLQGREGTEMGCSQSLRAGRAALPDGRQPAEKRRQKDQELSLLAQPRALRAAFQTDDGLRSRESTETGSSQAPLAGRAAFPDGGQPAKERRQRDQDSPSAAPISAGGFPRRTAACPGDKAERRAAPRLRRQPGQLPQTEGSLAEARRQRDRGSVPGLARGASADKGSGSSWARRRRSARLPISREAPPTPLRGGPPAQPMESGGDTSNARLGPIRRRRRKPAGEGGEGRGEERFIEWKAAPAGGTAEKDGAASSVWSAPPACSPRRGRKKEGKRRREEEE